MYYTDRMGSERSITVFEFAIRLSVDEETVRRWLRSGKVKGTRIGERRSGWRIPESEVRRLLDSPQVQSAVQARERRQERARANLTVVPCIGARAYGPDHTATVESGYVLITPNGHRLFACDSDCVRVYLDGLTEDIQADVAASWTPEKAAAYQARLAERGREATDINGN